MLAVRYGLMFPQDVDELALINPIGLEDWKAKGVPSLSIDQWYGRELNTAAETIRAYEKATYYAGEWRDSYEPWVQMLAGMYRFRALGANREIRNKNAGLRTYTLVVRAGCDTTSVKMDLMSTSASGFDRPLGFSLE